MCAFLYMCKAHIPKDGNSDTQVVIFPKQLWMGIAALSYSGVVETDALPVQSGWVR